MCKHQQTYLITAKPSRHHINPVEQGEERGRRLVYGADDGATLPRQQPQQHHQVTDRYHVQTSEKQVIYVEKGLKYVV